MTMFRRLKKSLQHKAWCMGSFLCRELDEEVYAHVRHRLQRCGGVETRVKLSAAGWTSGGGRNMPSQFYTLDMINAVESDPMFVNVLLCVFQRADAAVADFPFEVVAYKFDSANRPNEFHQMFNTLRGGGAAAGQSQSRRNGRGSTALAKKQSVLQVGARRYVHTHSTAFSYFVWLGGAVVRALDLRLEVAGSIPAAALSSATLDKLFTHIVQHLWCYNLIALYKSVFFLN